VCAGVTVAVWPFGRTQVKLEGKVWHRLDFLEVNLAKQGKFVGAVAIGLIAERAAELKCSGVLLASFPDGGLLLRPWCSSTWGQRLVIWARAGSFAFESGRIAALREMLREFETKEAKRTS